MRHEADVSPFPTHVRSLPSGHPTPKKAFLGIANMEKKTTHSCFQMLAEVQLKP